MAETPEVTPSPQPKPVTLRGGNIYQGKIDALRNAAEKKP